MWGAGIEKVRKNPAESQSRSNAAALLQRSDDCATEGSLANTKDFDPVVNPRQRIRDHGKKGEKPRYVELKIFAQTTSFNKHLHFWKPWTPHSTSCSKRGLLIFFLHCPLQDCNYRTVTKSHPSMLFISFTLALSPCNSNTLACGDRLKESSILAFWLPSPTQHWLICLWASHTSCTSKSKSKH